jgi:hypothetical protein
MRLACVALGTLIALSVSVAHAEVYRWTDADGVTHYSDVPPASADAKVRRLYDNSISTEGMPYALKMATQNFPLVLYVDTVCQAPCSQARSWLQQRKAPFSEKVMKTSDDLNALKALTGQTTSKVPVLTVGSKLIEGFEENAWGAALDAAGYPK